MAITLRNTKGSPLTNSELDENFSYLEKGVYSAISNGALHRSPNAITAMYIYDTSKDSDGGAWTEKCQNTSWYNEPLCGNWLGACASEATARAITGATTNDYFQLTTDGKFYKLNAGSGTTEVFRGNKAKFPKLVGIVAEAANVTLYDLTESGRPMWMRFGMSDYNSLASFIGYAANNTVPGGAVINIPSIYALNGRMYFCCAVPSGNGNCKGGRLVNFIEDSLYAQTKKFWWNVSQRHQDFRNNGDSSNLAGSLTGTDYNSVAMTVLSDAPTDSFSNLKIPTIAIGTGAGIYIIQNNGVIRNSSSTSAYTNVTLTPTLLSASLGSSATWAYALNPGSLGASFSLSTVAASAPPDFSRSNTNKLINAGRTQFIRAPSAALVGLLKNNEGTVTKGIAAQVANTYNTGWMVGDIRRCYLSDNTADNISGPELVLNNEFLDGTQNWTTYYPDMLSVSSGIATLNGSNKAYPSLSTNALNLTIGKKYLIKTSARLVNSGPEGVQIAFGTSPDFSSNASMGLDITANIFTEYTRIVTATATTMYAGFFYQTNNAIKILEIDNFSVKEIISDRSYKAAYSNIYGTLTKSQIANNTSLVAYSGFSANNYIQEPYSADLDFGTGEWSASAWVNVPTSWYNSSFNYISSPEDFSDSSWNKDGSNTIVPNSGSDPYGGNKATKFGTSHRIYYYFSSNFWVEAATYTFSIYAKADVGSILIIKPMDGWVVPNVTYTYDLVAKTATNSSYPNYLNTYSIEDVGNGWCRCTFTSNIKSNGVTLTYLELATSSLSNTILIYGAKLNKGPVPGTYTPGKTSIYLPNSPIFSRNFTTGSSIYLAMAYSSTLVAVVSDGTKNVVVNTNTTWNTGKVYNTGTWNKVETNYRSGRLSLLVNGVEVASNTDSPLLTLNAKYNQLTYSENFTSSGDWQRTRVTVIADAAIAPDGLQTADKIVEDSSTNTHYIAENFSSISTPYTISVYAKAAERNWLCIETAVSGGTYYNIATGALGTIASNVTATITSVGSDWYRLTYTYTGSLATVYISLATADNTKSYTGDSSSGLYLWGAQVVYGTAALDYQRVTTVAQTSLAPLTIGNSYALDAPFPGSLALVKLSATVPTAEQSLFMYAQESQLFRDGAQCVLPDSGAIVDLAYDDITDRWMSISASNESYWNGLVRTKVEPVSAGAYTKVQAGSNIHLCARSTTNPGVDITIPEYHRVEETFKYNLLASKNNQTVTVFDYDTTSFTATTTNGSNILTSIASVVGTPFIGMKITGTGIPTDTTIIGINGTTYYLSANATANGSTIAMGQADFQLPLGYTARVVYVAGTQKREGSSKDYTRLFDGFRETIRFGTSPGASSWVQIHAVRDL